MVHESATLVELTHPYKQLSWLCTFRIDICPSIVNHVQFKTAGAKTVRALLEDQQSKCYSAPLGSSSTIFRFFRSQWRESDIYYAFTVRFSLSIWSNLIFILVLPLFQNAQTHQLVIRAPAEWVTQNSLISKETESRRRVSACMRWDPTLPLVLPGGHQATVNG